MKDRVLKLIDIFENDGITPKENTYKMDYGTIKSRVLKELNQIEVGSGMILDVEGEDRTIHTSRVVGIAEVDNEKIAVTTKNTIYVFKVINTYEDR